MSNATVRGLLFLICSGIVRLLQATTVNATARYAELCERFPELGLPSTTPTFHVATSRDELQTAITTALSVAGDDVILLDGRTSQTWEGSSPITISGNVNNGSIFIVSQNPETGAFTQPVTFKGFGIAVGSTNSTPTYLANFAITESRSPTTTTRTGGFSAMGSGAIKGSCLSITECGTSAAGQICYAGGLYAASATVTLYNTTIANTQTVQFGAVTSINSTVTLVHCTIAGNRNATTGVTTGGTSTITTPNCWITADSLPITSIDTAVPHCVPTASSGALNTATETPSATITYDVLGNARISYDIADKGAVEHLEKVVVEPPTVVALPSGPREVYLGWSVIASALDYRLERSTDNGTSWVDITAKTLWRTPYDKTSNTEGTVMGWTSARYLEATPGETAQYRLSFAVAGLNDRITTTATVTSPALDAYPLYHSRPNAKQVIYLDFTGYVDDYYGSVSAAQVAFKDTNLTYIQTAPFEYNARFGDLSQPYPTASAIYDIWRMVAEDFAAFDVDVTTEAPTYDALVKSSEADMEYGKRVVIGYATGTSKPWYVGGGAFSGGGSFGFQHDRPVYIFSVQSRQNIAAQVTHEVSHTLGLAHDSGKIYLSTADIQDADGNWSTVYDYFTPESQSYYQGVEITPNGALSPKTNITWYPVMGGAPTVSSRGGYYYYDDADFINQWNNGTYSSAGNQEDDFAILLGLKEGSGTAFTDKPLLYSAASRNINLAEDDAGDTLTSAAALGTAQEGTLLTTNAIIGKHVSGSSVTNDVDLFSVTATTSGELVVSVVPNYLGLTEGSSLDAKVEVLNANGQCIGVATKPQWATNEYRFNDIRNAVCTALLPTAGTYYVRVSGTNHPVSSTTLSPDGSASESTPWNFNATDNTGSIGPYTLSTTFTEKEIEFVGDPQYIFVENDSAAWLNSRLPVNGDSITIDFGTTSNQTIDLASILGNTTQLGTVTTTGTNGGTITHTAGITATSVVINTNLTLPASFTTPEKTTIASNVSVYFTGETTVTGENFPYSGNRHFEAITFTGSDKIGTSITNYVIATNETMRFTRTNAYYTTSLTVDGGVLKTQGNAQAWFGGSADTVFAVQRGIADFTSVTADGNTNGVLIGYSGDGHTIAVSGGLLDASNTSIVGWEPNSKFHLTGGLVKTKGFRENPDTSKTRFAELILSGGTLELGTGGIPDLDMTTATLGAVTLRATADTTISEALNLTGAATLQAVSGKTLTVTGSISGEGTLAIGGTGTTMIRATDGTYTEQTVNATGTVHLGTNRPKLASIAEGASLKITLTDAELQNGLNWTVGESLTANDIARIQITNAATTAPTLTNGVLTASTLPITWENGVWSQTPVMGSGVTITFSEGHTTCTFTNTEAIALGSLTIAGNTAGTIVFGGAAVTVGAMTINPSAVSIPVSLFNSFTATTYTVAQGKTLTLTGDATINKTVNVYGTLALAGSMNFTGNNIVYNGGCLELLSGVTTFNTKNNDRGFQNGCTVKVAAGATLKNGVGDAPGYNKVTFDIAGTLEVTGTARWSLGSTAVITLREGAILKGAGGSGYNYAYDFFNGATLTVEGNATVEGNIGSHKGNEINFNIAKGKTLTLVGTYGGALGTDATGQAKLKVSGEGTLQLMSENTYTGGTTIGNGATLTMGHRGALGTGNITLEGGTIGAAPNTTDIQLTIASGKTLAGTGTITLPVVFDADATLNAMQGALTITGGVITPESGMVTVQASLYGDILTAANLNAESFTLATDPDGLLLATKTALVYTAKPTLPEGSTDVSDTALKQVAQLAAAEGILEVTLAGAPLPDQQRTVNIAGLELFNNVTDLVKGENNTGVVTVSYTFGIEHITLTADRKLVLTAKVGALQTRTVAPTFVKNVRVDFYNGSTVIGSATVTKDNQSSLTITTDQTIDQLLSEEDNALDLTVTVSNEAPIKQ